MKKFSVLLLVILCLSGCTAEQSEKSTRPQREEVVVALLDTGVSTVAVQSVNLRKGHNYVTGTENTEDRIDHGTAIAAVILGSESADFVGIAPNCALVPLVVTDQVDGKVESVTPVVLAQAIRDSVDEYGACVINVSLGIQKDDAALREAVAYVQKRGALVVSAVGNNGDRKELHYPAAYEGVLTVGSHDKDLKESDFSQRNGAVDILAPGEDVLLASLSGNPYEAKGTSFAAGYVSATAARLWQTDLTQTPEKIAQTILSTAQTVDGKKILNNSK